MTPFQPKAPGKGKTVALVLGSGGARGYAHIGVIEALEARGYKVVAIAGCSMGALIGGVYACGQLEPFKRWAESLKGIDIVRLLDLSLASPGAIRGEKVYSVVRDLIGETRIEDLPVTYTAVATDLARYKEVWFQNGPLEKAIRASTAIPSLITPMMDRGRILVDGGLLNPLPIIPVVSAHADMIVAVNLSHYDRAFEERFRLREKARSRREFEAWIEAVKQKASELFDFDALDEDEARAAPPPKKRDKKEDSEDQVHAFLSKFDIMNLSFETMQSALTQYKLAGYPPDVLINVPKAVCKTFDYHKAPELIQLGRALAEEALNQWENDGKSARAAKTEPDHV
ncbi:patatin-like phospholipase family protein [Hahella sp. SMD15-11]|uniref:Patatin-like phospholipase family protein n=1 Tax=Thermohahella caldifontis TaxID=3142973 RepID=A0AB39UXG8_9GAMM